MICSGCINATITQRLDHPKQVMCARLGRVPGDLVFCSQYNPSRVDAFYSASPLIIDPRPAPPSSEKGYV